MHHTIEELIATLPEVDVANPNMNHYVAVHIANNWFVSLPEEDRSFLRREWNKGECGALERDSRLCEFLFFLY